MEEYCSLLTFSFQVELQLPQEFGDKNRQDILASPTSVNLQELLPYYYASGAKMSKMYVSKNNP